MTLTLEQRESTLEALAAEIKVCQKCPLAKGHVGLQAEFFVIEFRNLKFKPLP